VEVQETPEWRREKVAFAGAGGERALAYLFLPHNYTPPFEVIHFAGAGDVARGIRSIADATVTYLAPCIKSGRAVLGVVLKGNVERPWPADRKQPEFGSVRQRDELIQAVTDCRRALDYVETRKDLDAGKIALYGLSAGAFPGLVLPAVEPRYRAVMLCGTGARKIWLRALPESNPLHFAPQIRIPKLMLSGRYDENFVFKSEIEPLYRLLRDPKRIEVYEGGHVPPFELFVPTMNRWLDETLGPVRHP
jgi:dienelactone hydrolase